MIPGTCFGRDATMALRPAERSEAVGITEVIMFAITITNPLFILAIGTCVAAIIAASRGKP
jgi:hypothetical protein